MSTLPLAISTFLRSIVWAEDGQDLVEYWLVLAMMTFGTVAGMGSLASVISDTLSMIATTITASV